MIDEMNEEVGIFDPWKQINAQSGSKVSDLPEEEIAKLYKQYVEESGKLESMAESPLSDSIEPLVAKPSDYIEPESMEWEQAFNKQEPSEQEPSKQEPSWRDKVSNFMMGYEKDTDELGDLHRRAKIRGLNHDQGAIDELTNRAERDRQADLAREKIEYDMSQKQLQYTQADIDQARGFYNDAVDKARTESRSIGVNLERMHNILKETGMTDEQASTQHPLYAELKARNADAESRLIRYENDAILAEQYLRGLVGKGYKPSSFMFSTPDAKLVEQAQANNDANFAQGTHSVQTHSVHESSAQGGSQEPWNEEWTKIIDNVKDEVYDRDKASDMADKLGITGGNKLAFMNRLENRARVNRATKDIAFSRSGQGAHNVSAWLNTAEGKRKQAELQSYRNQAIASAENGNVNDWRANMQLMDASIRTIPEPDVVSSLIKRFTGVDLTGKRDRDQEIRLMNNWLKANKPAEAPKPPEPKKIIGISKTGREL